MNSDSFTDFRGTQYVVWSDKDGKLWARVTPKKMPSESRTEGLNGKASKKKKANSLWNRSR